LPYFLLCCPISWHETIIGPLLARTPLLILRFPVLFKQFLTYFTIGFLHIFNNIFLNISWHKTIFGLDNMLAVAPLSILTVPTS
jgi:hypothetical protein